MPITEKNFDLRAHIESSGHQIDSSHVLISATACRGHLQKQSSGKLRQTWYKRWFVFDRASRQFSYFNDKSGELKNNGTKIPFEVQQHFCLHFRFAF